MPSRNALVLCALAVVAAAAAWSRTRDAGTAVEGQVRAAAFRYLGGIMLGDAAEHLKAVRLPLTVVRDGVAATRDEKQVRDQLARLAARSNLTEDDRKQVSANLLTLVDNADIQFVGADTATIAVVTRPGVGKADGDGITLLLLHRADKAWRVVAEVTDTRPVPPAYVSPPNLP